MEILKTCLIMFGLSVCLVGCKEATDKRKIEIQTPQININNTSSVAKDVNVQDFKRLIDENKGVILDVRTPKEYQSGHIVGAINIDWKNNDEFTSKIKEIFKDKTLLIDCRSGRRSGLAKEYLQKQGYQKVYNLESGILGWQKKNLATEK